METDFAGTIAFSSVGLPGSVINNDTWKEHERGLAVMLRGLHDEARGKRGSKLTALFLDEVGHMSDLCNPCGQRKIASMLRNSFLGGSNKPSAKVIWGDAETVGAVGTDVEVDVLPPCFSPPSSPSLVSSRAALAHTHTHTL